MIGLFLAGIIHNALRAFAGYRALLHIAAALITAALVLLGIDWWFFESTRAPWLRPIVFTAGIGGFFVPILVPLSIYAYGEWRKSEYARLMSAAVAQSVILAWCISSFYKALTGRIEPEFYPVLESMVDRSREFNFGFLEYGIFWGWPSSHTAVAFALAVSIAYFAAKRPGVRALAFAYAIFIGTGAAIGFHWLSDVLAGAIVGSVVGYAVASNFYRKLG